MNHFSNDVDSFSRPLSSSHNTTKDTFSLLKFPQHLNLYHDFHTALLGTRWAYILQDSNGHFIILSEFLIGVLFTDLETRGQ